MENTNFSIDLSAKTSRVNNLFYILLIYVSKSCNNSYLYVQDTFEEERQQNEKKGQRFSAFVGLRDGWKSRTVLERCLLLLACATFISMAVVLPSLISAYVNLNRLDLTNVPNVPG